MHADNFQLLPRRRKLPLPLTSFPVLRRSPISTMGGSKIPHLTCQQWAIGEHGYHEANKSYANDYYPPGIQPEHSQNPGLIVQPNNHADIAKVLQYARQCTPPKPVAIRTGGHQYSGASSTGRDGILLDLKKTFSKSDITFLPGGDNASVKNTHVRTSVSWTLQDFNKKLADTAYVKDGKQYGYFVPHGQCCSVNLGGHLQTGGYGQLSRSFVRLLFFGSPLPHILNASAMWKAYLTYRVQRELRSSAASSVTLRDIARAW